MALPVLVSAQAQQFPTISAEGVLVDMVCFARNVHKVSPSTVVDMCGRGVPGNPVAIVDPDSQATFYTLASPPILLSEHLSKTIRVTGEHLSASVIKPETLEVWTGTGWLNVPTMPEM